MGIFLTIAFGGEGILLVIVFGVVAAGRLGKWFWGWGCGGLWGDVGLALD